MVLLGAGASAEAGIPTTFSMTEQLVTAIDESRYAGHPLSAALHFVCGALLAYDAADGQNPFQGLDVERVFAAIELVAERQSLEVSPFVASWHPAVDAFDNRPQPVPGLFDSQLQDAVLGSESFNSAGKLIANLVKSLTDAAPTGEVYRELATVMLSELRKLIATTPKEASYLSPLIALANGNRSLTIATLNYDVAIEQTSEQAGVACSTGIVEWITAGKWSWPRTGIRLLKLHGSIDWVWERQEHRDGHLPLDAIRITEDAVNETNPPALVFGQRGKLRAEGPFLSLLGEFERHLSDARHLLVIGYSFRDNHVNELIRRWTSEDITRMITVVDPNWPESFRGGSPEDFRQRMDSYLLPPHWDEEQFAPRLEIRREPCSEALEKLAS